MNNYRTSDVPRTILDGVSAVGAGTTMHVKDFSHLALTFAVSGFGAGDTAVLKVQGSQSATAPTFGSAQAYNNLWDYVLIVDLEDGSNVAGDDGVTFATTDDVRQFEVNTNGLHWVTVNVISISDANTKAYAYLQCFNE